MTLLEFTSEDGVQVFLPFVHVCHWTSEPDGTGLVVHTTSGCRYHVHDPAALLRQIAIHVIPELPEAGR